MTENTEKNRNSEEIAKLKDTVEKLLERVIFLEGQVREQKEEIEDLKERQLCCQCTTCQRPGTIGTNGHPSTSTHARGLVEMEKTSLMAWRDPHLRQESPDLDEENDDEVQIVSYSVPRRVTVAASGEDDPVLVRIGNELRPRAQTEDRNNNNNANVYDGRLHFPRPNPVINQGTNIPVFGTSLPVSTNEIEMPKPIPGPSPGSTTPATKGRRRRRSSSRQVTPEKRAKHVKQARIHNNTKDISYIFSVKKIARKIMTYLEVEDLLECRIVSKLFKQFADLVLLKRETEATFDSEIKLEAFVNAKNYYDNLKETNWNFGEKIMCTNHSYAFEDIPPGLEAFGVFMKLCGEKLTSCEISWGGVNDEQYIVSMYLSEMPNLKKLLIGGFINLTWTLANNAVTYPLEELTFFVEACESTTPSFNFSNFFNTHFRKLKSVQLSRMKSSDLPSDFVPLFNMRTRFIEELGKLKIALETIHLDIKGTDTDADIMMDFVNLRQMDLTEVKSFSAPYYMRCHLSVAERTEFLHVLTNIPKLEYLAIDILMLEPLYPIPALPNLKTFITNETILDNRFFDSGLPLKTFVLHVSNYCTDDFRRIWAQIVCPLKDLTILKLNLKERVGLTFPDNLWRSVPALKLVDFGFGSNGETCKSLSSFFASMRKSTSLQTLRLGGAVRMDPLGMNFLGVEEPLYRKLIRKGKFNPDSDRIEPHLAELQSLVELEIYSELQPPTTIPDVVLRHELLNMKNLRRLTVYNYKIHSNFMKLLEKNVHVTFLEDTPCGIKWAA